MNRFVKIREGAIESRVIRPTRHDSSFAAIRTKATMLVPGVGNIMAPIVICGEGPGQEEDRCGLPFVGPAGQLLTQLLVDAQVDRTRCWVTNMLKYRATDSNGADRRPYGPESVAAKLYLSRELDIIQPRLVVVCGSTVFRAIRPGESITKEAGRPFGSRSWPGRIYLPVIHPAACLRDDQLLERTRADFRLIPELVARAAAE
jgi:uracil-DNA glycosylase